MNDKYTDTHCITAGRGEQGTGGAKEGTWGGALSLI